MKNNRKTHSVCSIFLVALMAFSGTFTLFSINQSAYAEEGFSTYEEFNAQIEDVRLELAEYEDRLSRIKELSDYIKYHDLLNLLQQYINTESVAEWKSTGFGMTKRYHINAFTYDPALFENLVAGIRAVEPDFRLADDAANNNIVSSIINIQTPELAAIIYEMLHIGQINFMLSITQDYYNRNSSASPTSEVIEEFKASAKSGFETNALPYIYMAGLYNRILDHESYAEVQQILQAWEDNYEADYLKLKSTLTILEHGESLTTTDYFPGYTGFGQKRQYLGKSIAENLGEAYTLQQLVEYLPNHTVWPLIDKDETIAFFQSIYETEVQNLKDALSAIDPSLTNLDLKTTEELVALGSEIAKRESDFSRHFTTATAENKTLINLMVDFSIDALGLLDHPEAKYFATVASQSAIGTPSILGKTSATALIENIPDQSSIHDYYGRIGNAALQLNRTITDGLYPHEDWIIPPAEDSGNSNPNDSENQPSNPGANSTDLAQKSNSQTVSVPNTGFFGTISSSAEATIGFSVICGLIFAFIVARRKSRR